MTVATERDRLTEKGSAQSLLCYSWPAYCATLRVATPGRRSAKPRGSTAKSRLSLPGDGAAFDHR